MEPPEISLPAGGAHSMGGDALGGEPATGGDEVPAGVAATGELEVPASRIRGIWIRENIEAIVVAVIIALLIRHFCIEAFKIPTGSMEPTLIGMETNGDRILVNKFIYNVRAPRRYEIVVFRYPLDRSHNFVKRLVGLPGEDIELRDGDVYANGRIARKPADLQAELFANWRLYPAPAPSPDWRSDFRSAGPGEVAETVDGFRLETAAEVLLQYHGPITIASRHLMLPVGDRLIRASFRLEGPGGMAILFLDEGNDRFRLEVASRESGGGLRLRRGGQTLAERPDLSLVPGKAMTLELSNPDDTVVAAVDGREVSRIEYEPSPGPGSGLGGQAIGFGAAGGRATVSDVAIYRDLYYTPEGETRVHVPDDALFVLGDNSPSSKDGRLWAGRWVTLSDGTRAFVDADTRIGDAPASLAKLMSGSGSGVSFVDEFGERFDRQELGGDVQSGPRERRPFVPMELLMGKAFFVFWPPARREPAGWRINWKFVR